MQYKWRWQLLLDLPFKRPDAFRLILQIFKIYISFMHPSPFFTFHFCKLYFMQGFAGQHLWRFHILYTWRLLICLGVIMYSYSFPLSGIITFAQDRRLYCNKLFFQFHNSPKDQIELLQLIILCYLMFLFFFLYHSSTVLVSDSLNTPWLTNMATDYTTQSQHLSHLILLTFNLAHLFLMSHNQYRTVCKDFSLTNTHCEVTLSLYLPNHTKPWYSHIAILVFDNLWHYLYSCIFVLCLWHHVYWWPFICF